MVFLCLHFQLKWYLFPDTNWVSPGIAVLVHGGHETCYLNLWLTNNKPSVREYRMESTNLESKQKISPKLPWAGKLICALRLRNWIWLNDGVWQGVIVKMRSVRYLRILFGAEQASDCSCSQPYVVSHPSSESHVTGNIYIERLLLSLNIPNYKTP